VKMTLLFLFAALTASAQNKTENLPVTDAEKIADALRAAPAFITADATIVDHPVSKGDEWRVLRKGSSEWTCMPGPPPGSKHDDPGCFDKVFFQFVKDVLAGRPQHVERLGVAYMYTGHTVQAHPASPFVWARTLWSSVRTQMSYRVSSTAGGTAHTPSICPGAEQPGQWFLVIPIEADSHRK